MKELKEKYPEKIIDGKKISSKILENLKIRIQDIKKITNMTPSLTVILVGDDEASKIYINNKNKACESIGINSKNILLPSNISVEELKDIIIKENKDENTTGILLQLPLPKHFNELDIINTIDPEKDMDGFTSHNLGKLMLNDETNIACTPKGVLRLLKECDIDVVGKDITIIGRSNMVGKPLANLLINHSATITLCHTKTQNLKEKLRNSDIIISATGYKGVITKETNLKDGVILVDVGITRENNKIRGDIDFDVIEKKEVSKITPVPGGVGPMTIASLVENLVEKFEKDLKKKGIL